jgi:hypothetical protein
MLVPQATSGNGNADRTKCNKTAPIGNDAESVNSCKSFFSQPITCDRWVPEHIFMDEMCIQKDMRSVKSMKDAQKKLTQ